MHAVMGCPQTTEGDHHEDIRASVRFCATDDTFGDCHLTACGGRKRLPCQYQSTSSTVDAIWGYNTSSGVGVFGAASSYGIGVEGSCTATGGTGVNGDGGETGVYGSGGTYGVDGYSGSSIGVYGESTSGNGLYGESYSGYGLYATSSTGDGGHFYVYNGNSAVAGINNYSSGNGILRPGHGRWLGWEL